MITEFSAEIKTELDTLIRRIVGRECKIAFTQYTRIYADIQITNMPTTWSMSLYEMKKIEQQLQNHSIRLVDMTFLEDSTYNKPYIIIVCGLDNYDYTWFNRENPTK